MDLEPITIKATQPSLQNAGDAEAFFATDHQRPRYAIGRNMETLAVHQLAPLDGIIDDSCHEGDHWNGIPLFRTAKVPRVARVVNCSTSIRPVNTRRHLVEFGFRSVVGFSDLTAVADGALPLPEFVIAQRKEIAAHLPAWQRIHDALEDEVSRRTLRDVLAYRLSADCVHMLDYSVRLDQQYFEDFMEYRQETFVDAGAFDGDTAQEFADKYPDYRSILLFEPSATNMALARTRLAGYRDMRYIQKGLSETLGHLCFDADQGSASAIRADGVEEIEVDRLDSLASEPVSFIKMDLEGWELPALKGSRRHIEEDQPKLALAVYHSAPDLRLIHDYIASFGHRYRLFLRHYTQGWSETVLFFKPFIDP